MTSHFLRPLKNLFDSILMLKTPQEMENFFKDLCTPQEISALKERWKVCQLLEGEDLSYREIHNLTGASLTTIGRVARFLKEEPYQGYKTLLMKLNQEDPS
ncbi:MAG: transcriptional regulator [Proteobacteria bacterium]|nr:transcriptional regulator [Pseudomonadota bacterium]